MLMPMLEVEQQLFQCQLQVRYKVLTPCKWQRSTKHSSRKEGYQVTIFLTFSFFLQKHNYELQCQKTCLWICAPSEDLDQTAHLRSLIKIFTRHILNSQGCKVSSNRQWRHTWVFDKPACQKVHFITLWIISCGYSIEVTRYLQVHMFLI